MVWQAQADPDQQASEEEKHPDNGNTRDQRDDLFAIQCQDHHVSTPSPQVAR